MNLFFNNLRRPLTVQRITNTKRTRVFPIGRFFLEIECVVSGLLEIPVLVLHWRSFHSQVSNFEVNIHLKIFELSSGKSAAFDMNGVLSKGLTFLERVDLRSIGFIGARQIKWLELESEFWNTFHWKLFKQNTQNKEIDSHRKPNFPIIIGNYWNFNNYNNYWNNPAVSKTF